MRFSEEGHKVIWLWLELCVKLVLVKMERNKKNVGDCIVHAPSKNDIETECI